MRVLLSVVLPRKAKRCNLGGGYVCFTERGMCSPGELILGFKAIPRNSQFPVGPTCFRNGFCSDVQFRPGSNDLGL